MSRTIRYFKLMYIVAGILLSNEAICETVDQIQIAPRLTHKTEQTTKCQQHSKQSGLQSLEIREKKLVRLRKWYQQLFIYRLIRSFRSLFCLRWRMFSVWSMLNYFVECMTCLLSRTFVINSDCDVIYK